MATDILVNAIKGSLLGAFRLDVKYPDIVVKEYVSGAFVSKIHIPYLRKFGQKGERFTFEPGSRCVGMEGIHHFLLEDEHINLADVINTQIKKSAADETTIMAALPVKPHKYQEVVSPRDEIMGTAPPPPSSTYVNTPAPGAYVNVGAGAAPSRVAAMSTSPLSPGARGPLARQGSSDSASAARALSSSPDTLPVSCAPAGQKGAIVYADLSFVSPHERPAPPKPAIPVASVTYSQVNFDATRELAAKLAVSAKPAVSEKEESGRWIACLPCRRCCGDAFSRRRF